LQRLPRKASAEKGIRETLIEKTEGPNHGIEGDWKADDWEFTVGGRPPLWAQEIGVAV